jgi:hypothetical protein
MFCVCVCQCVCLFVVAACVLMVRYNNNLPSWLRKEAELKCVVFMPMYLLYPNAIMQDNLNSWNTSMILIRHFKLICVIPLQAICTNQLLPSGSYHSCFMFGMFQIQISAQKLAVLADAFKFSLRPSRKIPGSCLKLCHNQPYPSTFLSVCCSLVSPLFD